MQQAIPAAEYSADERAERAKGAAIAFVACAALLAWALTLIFF